MDRLSSLPDTAAPDLGQGRVLRGQLRRALPGSVFVHRPHRFLYLFPMLALIVAGTAALAVVPLPWYLGLLGSLAVGGVYGSLFFFGHEAGHGSIVTSRWLQYLVLYCSMAIYCLSPHLWRVWHNQVHHARTNLEVNDPDTWGTLASYRQFRAARIGFRFSPGSGRWTSALYLPTWFTIHAQHVLWSKSRRAPGFEGLSRTRAAIDSLIMAGFWLGLAIALGPWRALLCVVIPMGLANAIIMSYISTNHMISPMVDSDDVLDSSMSVTSWRIVDWLHFRFSHHVEHHLFPAMGSDQAPAVRRELVRIAGDRYLAPPHGRALVVLFRTPRVYLAPRVLYDPVRDIEVSIDEVRAMLRGSSRARLGRDASGQRVTA